MRKTAIALIFALLLTCGAAGASALGGVDNHWAGKYAAALYDMGIFKGDDAGSANLASNIRRIEFLALLVRAVYSEEEIISGKKSFSDVAYGTWYYDIASFAKQEGIVQGDDAGQLLPNDNIKREEIVLMLVRTLELSGGAARFSDIDSRYPYYEQIAAAAASGIIRGYSDGTFAPKNNATRGEAATMIARMLGLTFDEEQPSGGEIINLTWHHVGAVGITSTGDYMQGLNVISPTWFRIRSFSDEKPASYEYKLDGSNNYYLQDIGNTAYIRDARANGYQVWALFKSNDFSANNNSGFLNDEAARKSAVALMKTMIEKYDLDGINMDFENMLVSDRDVYTQFVKEMSEMMADTGAVLSVDVTKYSSMGGTWSLCYDRAGIAKYADYVALMAYDQNGAGSSVAGSVGDLPWVEAAIQKTLTEVPAEKLILGVPFYARLWQTKGGKVIKTSAIGMDTAQRTIAEAGAKIVYDEKTGQNYAAWEKDGIKFEIWIEDSMSVEARIALMKKYNLAGIASWSKGFETPSIWGVINDSLYGK